MPPIKKLGRKIFKNRSTRDVKRNTKQHPHAPSPIVGEEYVCYEVEHILDSKPGDCGSLYLVKWAGYGSGYNSWISELPPFFQKYNKATFTDDEESDLDDEESDFEPDEVDDSSEDNMSDSSLDSDSDCDSDSEDELSTPKKTGGKKDDKNKSDKKPAKMKTTTTLDHKTRKDRFIRKSLAALAELVCDEDSD